ncbi:Dynein light chain Tctex-type 3 [Heterocephalus glaber]|uniref:Dynein light chain Tctex-type 3 n=1 Tax=Heterocephalus glaber TaxID=10181 RepID=G5AQB8_HETGA|nr:Dynein light chain Tctex-type 3 [Heterocephalus glaber]
MWNMSNLPVPWQQSTGHQPLLLCTATWFHTTKTQRTPDQQTMVLSPVAPGPEVGGVLGGEDYNQNNINQWTASIVEQSLTHLVKLGKADRYIAMCAVVHRGAYGSRTASSWFWDTASDGTRTTNCIVNVFAIAIVL